MSLLHTFAIVGGWILGDFWLGPTVLSALGIDPPTAGMSYFDLFGVAFLIWLLVVRKGEC